MPFRGCKLRPHAPQVISAYVVCPFFAWLCAGSLKFAVNTLRSRSLAWQQIGYGGFPSTHTSIVTATAALVALREGWNTPAFAVAVTLAFIVVLDASSLRRQVGNHATALNRLLRDGNSAQGALRERMGHTKVEVAGGITTGFVCALLLHTLLP